MSTILLHPSVANVRALERLEQQTGLQAVPRGPRRIHLVTGPASARPLFHTTARTARPMAADPDDQPTPPTAA